MIVFMQKLYALEVYIHESQMSVQQSTVNQHFTSIFFFAQKCSQVTAILVLGFHSCDC
jgi:hypothetical protein